VIWIGQAGEPPKPLWSRSIQDRYGDPGTPLNPRWRNRILQVGDSIYLVAQVLRRKVTAVPRPVEFADSEAERLFRSDASQYESFVALLDDDAKQFITRHESPTAAPNYYLRRAGEAVTSMPTKALTNFLILRPSFAGSRSNGNLQTCRWRAMFIHSISAAWLQEGTRSANCLSGPTRWSLTIPAQRTGYRLDATFYANHWSIASILPA